MSYANINEGKKLVNPEHPNAIPTVEVEAGLQSKFPDLLFPYMKQDHVAGVNSNVHAWCDKHQSFTRLSVAGARHRGTKYGCSLCANEHKGGVMPEGVSKRYNTAGYIGRVGVQSGIFRAVKAVFPDAVWEYRMANGKEIDIYVPSIRAGIEYNGNYYHSTAVGKKAGYHLNKTVAALYERGKGNGDLILHVMTEEAQPPYTNLVHILKEVARHARDIPQLGQSVKYQVVGKDTADAFHRAYNFRQGLSSYQQCTHHTGVYGPARELVAVVSAKIIGTTFVVLQLTVKDSSYAGKIGEMVGKAVSLAAGRYAGVNVLAALANPLEWLTILGALRGCPSTCIPPLAHQLDSQFRLAPFLPAGEESAKIYDAGYMCIGWRPS